MLMKLIIKVPQRLDISSMLTNISRGCRICIAKIKECLILKNCNFKKKLFLLKKAIIVAIDGPSSSGKKYNCQIGCSTF